VKMCRAVAFKGGVTAIEALQQHKNYDVYEKAIALLTQHFECDEVRPGTDDVPQDDFEEEGETVLLPNPAPMPGRGMPLPHPSMMPGRGRGMPLPPPNMMPGRGRLPPPPDLMMMGDFGDDLDDLPLDYDF